MTAVGSGVIGLLPGVELPKHDIEKLAESWITLELATQAQLRRVTSDEAAAYLGRRNTADYAGMLFPYILPGENVNRGARLRRDHPDIRVLPDGTHKQEAKYLTAPGSRLMFYFTPGTPPEWLTDASIPVCIVEGEKKTIALYRLATYETEGPRFLPIGIAGVTAWFGRVGIRGGPDGARVNMKGPIPDFERVVWKGPEQGRKVYICFDSDVRTNPTVKRERRKLARELKRRGARVFFVPVPDGAGGTKQGVDDWLGSADPEPVLRAFREAVESDGVTVPSGFSVEDSGVYSVDPTGETDPIFICSRLEISACTRDAENEDWGRWLKWWDPDGNVHLWAMPMSLLAGDGSEIRARLLAGGLQVSTSRRARELLTTYIQNAKPPAKARCVSRVGWQDDVYVMPDVTFGSDEEEPVLFQSAAETDHRYRTAGTLDDWKSEVGVRCRGNNLLLFAASCGFAGPMLDLTGAESGGFHFRGPSSTGKTTLLLVAGSVCGGGTDGFVQSWRATANGLEAVAALHNDGLLCLDEIGQVDKNDAGEIAYLLANGRGKNRMNKGTGARKTLSWRLLYLSSGEISLADLVRSAGAKTRAGQEIRLLDIDADAGAGSGAFQDLHGAQNGHAFAEALKAAALAFYGTPLRAFLDFVIDHRDEIRTAAGNYISAFIAEQVPAGSCGEISRAAARFALVGSAGEIATEAGVTGWAEGDAGRAASACFNAWLKTRGSSQAGDAEAAIAQVRQFIERHGCSRFQAVDLRVVLNGAVANERIYDRAGFKCNSDNGVEYLVLPETFKNEVCRGFNSTMVARVLAERGYLTVEPGGKYSVRRDLPELGRKRVYAIKADVLNTEEV